MTTSQPAPAAVVASTPSVSLTTLPLPSRLFVPLSDPAAVHPPGTRLRRGEPLTTTPGPGRAALAPAAGTVIGVVEVELAGGGKSSAVELEIDYADSHDAAATPPSPSPPPTDLPGLIERLRGAGVQANRHTSPDLLAQLHAAALKPVDTLVCNLLDAAGESALCAAVMRSSGKDVISALSALAQLTGASRVWIAAGSNLFNRASAVLRKNRGGPRMKVVGLQNAYPQADPSLLVYALLDRRLPPGRLPTDANVLLLDAPAAAAVGRCLARAEPMLEAPVEIRDSAQSRCSVYNAPVGTPLRFVLNAMGLDPLDRTLRAGPALRDIRCAPTAVIDGVNELSIDAGPPSPSINPDPCIRCGWCVDACPTRIHPAGLLEAAQDNDALAAQRFGLPACIECGICSYVCPSRLPLLPAIRHLRRTLSAERAS